MILLLLLAIAIALAVAQAAAQTPDTTTTSRYYPLAVGNERHDTVAYYDGYRTDYGQVRRTVVHADGGTPERFTINWLRTYRQFPDSPVTVTTGSYETYFDPATATANGSASACRLDAPFGASTVCDTRPYAVTGGHGQTVTIGAQTVVTTRKQFYNYTSSPSGSNFSTHTIVVAAGIGQISSTSLQTNNAGYTSTDTMLRYARVGGTVYGTPLTFPTAGEAAPDAAALALSVGPNPASAAATVRYTLAAPAAVRVTVVDVLGRAVARPVDGARAAGPHTEALGVAGLPAGVYTVRLEVGGWTAVRRLSVVR